MTKPYLGRFAYFAKNITILFSYCIIYPCLPQSRVIDSLKNRLQIVSDLEKIKIHYALGKEFFSSDQDVAVSHYNEGLRLAQKVHNDSFAGRCMNKIGDLYYNSGDYEKAIRYLYGALKIFERSHDQWRAMRCLQYLGLAYNEQGMHDKALDYAKRALSMCRELGDRYSEAESLTHIGSVYFSQSDYDKALAYFQQALQIMEELKHQNGIADALNNLAVIYEKKKELPKALWYHLRSLALAREMNDSRGLAASYNNIGQVYKAMGKYSIAIHYLDSSIALSKAEDNKFYLKESYGILSEIYAEMGRFDMAYKTHLLFSTLNDTLMSSENKKLFAEMNTKYETEKKDHQISSLKKDKDLQEEKVQNEKTIRNAFVLGFLIVFLFAMVIFFQRNRIKKGKKRSDELLLNILPSETAEELKSTGEAQAKQFDEVTVLFTDFKNFTALSEKFSAQQLVSEINYYYSAFDQIISKNNIEKIKTIGDSYMCAGGLPVANKTNAVDIINTAIDIRDFILQEKKQREREGRHFFEIRIGCHTGPVVAGIVGIKKFAYDIWGDTVNVAARMEQNSEPGKINISATTYELVKDKFVCSHRGKISAKNKGEIDMYFVEHPL